MLPGTQTIQVVGRTPMLLIPQIHHNLADLVVAYIEMLLASPITHANQPVLLFTTRTCTTTVTVKMLSQALLLMLQSLKLDKTLYSRHSLRRRWGVGAITVSKQGAQQMDSKRHGLWASPGTHTPTHTHFASSLTHQHDSTVIC